MRCGPNVALAMLAVLFVAAGCEVSDHTVTVCGRGDRDELVEAMRGGRFELSFRGADGAEIGTATADADRPSTLPSSLPEGTAAVEVVGVTASGTTVARGTAPVESGRACVCFALDSQHTAVCAGVACEPEGGACRFYDRETGGPAAVRTVTFGDGAGADVGDAVVDTTLSSAAGEVDLNFGKLPRLRVAADPVKTALVQFDLSALPHAIRVESATLSLTPCTESDCAATGAAALYAIIESWQEGDAAGTGGCASWNCREGSLAWSVPGAGYLSERNRSREAVSVAQAEIGAPGEPVAFDVTELVARWHADPASNHGLAITVGEGGAVDFGASESSTGPLLSVRFQLLDPGERPDAGGPPDAGPMPDGGGGGGMVEVPAGVFLMGCDPTAGTCDENNVPVHAVSLSAFEIDRTEVTQAEYAACVADGACAVPTCSWDPEQRADYPVTCMTWTDARNFCTFAGKRLPTEAEWEKAARGTDGRLYPWGNDEPSCTVANAFGCVGAVQPVGLRPDGASPYGALDMAGNAAELVFDRFRADYYESSPTKDPTGPATGNRRVRRGGSYGGGAALITTFKRTSRVPTAASQNTGFRCARDLP